MLQLIDHYKIQGAVEAYPIKGFAPATWLPWYELALAIAKELDTGLKYTPCRAKGHRGVGVAAQREQS